MLVALPAALDLHRRQKHPLHLDAPPGQRLQQGVGRARRLAFRVPAPEDSNDLHGSTSCYVQRGLPARLGHINRDFCGTLPHDGQVSDVIF